MHGQRDLLNWCQIPVFRAQSNFSLAKEGLHGEKGEFRMAAASVGVEVAWLFLAGC
jgi:hypothetical protein